jgi:hypothetical protein
MTFTKYVALMLLGFALFVGWGMHRESIDKQKRCDNLRTEYMSHIGNDNFTGAQLNAEWHGYVAVCSPTFEQPTQ